MKESSLQKGESKWARYIWTGCFFCFLVIEIVLYILAAIGAEPFDKETGEISEKHDSCLTPKDYTYFVLYPVIYVWLMFNAIYAIVILFKKDGDTAQWRVGGAVSNAYLGFISINLIINILWLFFWTLDFMVASATLLLIVSITNTAALCFSLYSFMKAAPYLYENSKTHFWLGIVFINGQGLYEVWTSLLAIINVALMIDDVQREIIIDDVCIGCLSIILIAFVISFILEQTVFVTFANPLITHYIVYIWTMMGIYVKNQDDASDAVKGLIMANHAMGYILLVLKVGFVVYRNRNNQIYNKD